MFVFCFDVMIFLHIVGQMRKNTILNFQNEQE
jgi:hypothetical protein